MPYQENVDYYCIKVISFPCWVLTKGDRTLHSANQARHRVPYLLTARFEREKRRDKKTTREVQAKEAL